MSRQPTELFQPPNMLKAKVGGGGGAPVLDTAAIKRAEAAMDALKGEFAEWAAEDVKKLVSARQAYAATPNAETRGALLRAAHDLKGQAATFDFPLVARVSGSLSKLLYDLPPEKELPLSLVDAHVSAIHVLHRDSVHNMSDKMTNALIQELEKQVGDLLDDPKG